jgi:hypothetical protein
MTEQDFLRQVWRPYDKITTADGVPGKVLGVSFTTKSVRAFISGAPEWVSCTLIETHTTGKGADGDDVASIEELHNKVLNQSDEINRLREEKKALAEKISKNYLGDLLRAVNLMEQGLREKKHKMDQIDSGLKQIQDALAKMESDDD